jgi:hypothetical protein
VAKKLTDTQRVLIANAAKRPSLRLLPAPKSLNKNAGTIAVSIKSMLSAGFVETAPADPGDIIWPTAGDDNRLTLVVNMAGLAAVGIDEGTAPVAGPPKKSAKTQPETLQISPRVGTKLATLIEMLSRKGGATLIEIATVTEWQHHSIRGAISGALKKKLGIRVTSDVIEDRGRAYRIVATEKSTADGKAKRSSRRSVAA